MSEPRRPLRAITLVVAAAAAAAIVGTGGCSKSSSAVPSPVASPTPTASGSPTPTPSPTPTANVFVSMAYASMSPTIDPTYGQVDGYAQISPPPTPAPSPTPTPSPAPSPQTPGPSSIVTVPCNVNIQFLNFDKSNGHTASLLNGPGFPQFFNNPQGLTSSVQLTPISFPNFSTGYVLFDQGFPGRSAVYTTGSQSGTYYFGDYFNYNSTPSMRTVINVTGC